MNEIRSMVAVGDSFTEGLGDEVLPDGHFRGWADRLAERLAEAAAPEPFRYANLGVRGKLIGQILADQVDTAAAMGTDLVTLNGGLNDMMRPGCDLARVRAQVLAAADRLCASGATLLTFYAIDPSRRMRGGARMLPALAQLHETVAELERRPNTVVVDLFTARCFDDPRLWDEDRLHMSAEGHRRVAEACAQALGLPARFDWREPLPAAAAAPLAVRLRRDLRWLRVHVLPWALRRLTGKSSGDNRPPKRPELLAVE
ncbi:SGNH/GDSL hydrolase family protein [Streptacidiphilus monticola]|uniref:SGNH/GDSL hydrolase family protein n=1 Tax=Streptacidiphilus monticola TaxID=2161674 RepID=A0ABW1FVT3_9ACTN